MKTRIYVTRDIPSAGIEKLRKAGYEVDVNPHDRDLDTDELKQAIAGAEAVICMLTNRIDRDVLESAPSVRIFSNYAVGYNNFDMEAATEHGVALTNTPGVLTDATADLAWALLFSAARRVIEADPFVRQNKFDGWAPKMFLGADITGQTLGIIGAGRIGTAMALRSQGFGMKVLYMSNRDNPVLDSQLGAKRVDLDTLLKESDFISLHCPLTEETKHLIGKEEIAKMRPSAILINTARGPVVYEAALVEALREKKIAAAGLDVYEEEPKLAPGLSELDNVVLLPHIGSATIQTRQNMSLMVADNVLACLNGERPANLLNPEIMEK